MNKVRILVADDHDVVRIGIRALLESESGWEVCGEAATGRDAVQKAEELKPDLVIMDISMPDLGGLEATRQILKASPQTEVLILTMHDSDDLLRDVLDAGARGYVLKADAPTNLVAAVSALCHHNPYFTSRMSETILQGYLNREPPPERKGAVGGRLTPREREIVQLLAEGKSNKDIAVALGIRVKTADTHRANVMNKLGLHSVADLVRYAVRNRIVEP